MWPNPVPIEVLLEPVVCYACGEIIGPNRVYLSPGAYKGPFYHKEHAPPGHPAHPSHYWFQWKKGEVEAIIRGLRK
jgi:hypothetical protein